MWTVICMCMCAHACRGQRTISGFSSQVPSTWLFWDRVSYWPGTCPCSLGWPVSEFQGSCCLHLPSAGTTSVYYHEYVGSEEANLGLPACKANTLPMEPCDLLWYKKCRVSAVLTHSLAIPLRWSGKPPAHTLGFLLILCLCPHLLVSPGTRACSYLTHLLVQRITQANSTQQNESIGWIWASIDVGEQQVTAPFHSFHNWG